MLLIGCVGSEASVGGPIALVEDGDKIIIDLRLNEVNRLNNPNIRKARGTDWKSVVSENKGSHPSFGIADTRLLHRARHSEFSPFLGGGMLPNQQFWIRIMGDIEETIFAPIKKFR